MARSGFRFPFLPLPARLALLIGLAANIALFLFVARLEDRREESLFRQLAMRRFSAIEIGVSNAMEASLSINRWFGMMDDMSDAKFAAFIDPVLQAHPYFIAYGYQAVVSGRERATFEARMQRHRPGFVIRDMLPDGSFVPAAPAAAYRVIEYIHPLVGNEVLPGFNTGSMSVQNEAAARASETGKPASTRLFGLMQFDDRPQGFLVMTPMRRKTGIGLAAPEAKAEIVGYTVSAFLAAELFRKILWAARLLDDPGMSISLYAGAPNPFESLVYRNAGPARADGASTLCRLYRAQDHAYSQELRIADAAWRIGVTGRAQSCLKTHSGSLLLLAGIVGSLMAATYLTVLHSRALQLAQVNALLSASRERFRHLVDMSSDWYWEQDDRCRFTLLAGRMMNEDPKLREKLLGKTRWEIAAPWFGQEKVDAHRALVAQRKPFRNFEYPVLAGHNKVIWLSVNGEPLFDAEGGFIGYRGTSKDIGERKQAENLLRQLTAHREAIKEQERKRIAREIHDELGQTLLAVRLDAVMLQSRARSCPHLRARATLALDQIDGAMASMRMIINDLRPPVLDLGIDAAIEWQVAQFRQRSGIACDLVWDSDAIMLDERIATALFRIVQESLSNVLKHSSARRVQIRLHSSAEELTMQIADDGVGADAKACSKPNAFGLAGIGERVLALGGRFELFTAPGAGMRLVIRLPAGADRMATSQEEEATILRARS